MNRPANESSPVSRGPLVEMGSFTICTKTSCPTESTCWTLPSFFKSGNLCALLKG